MFERDPVHISNLICHGNEVGIHTARSKKVADVAQVVHVDLYITTKGNVIGHFADENVDIARPLVTLDRYLQGSSGVQLHTTLPPNSDRYLSCFRRGVSSKL